LKTCAPHWPQQRGPGQSTLNGSRQSYTIGANDQLLTSGDYKPVIVAYRNGAAVRASDVATIVDAAENSQQAAWMDRQPAVIVNIQRQPAPTSSP